jgi:hypothetical protein
MGIAHVQTGAMQRCILLLILWAASIAQLAAQWTASPEERQSKALKVVASVKYQNLITQHAKTGEAPAPDEFIDWLVREVNNPSLLRDQIAEDIDEIENNGRNGLGGAYLTTDGNYVKRLLFEAGDVKVRRVGGEKEMFVYQASFHTQDNFHRGWSEIDFVFKFQVKVEFFKFTNAYQVTVVSYPKFERKNEKANVVPRAEE